MFDDSSWEHLADKEEAAEEHLPARLPYWVACCGVRSGLVGFALAERCTNEQNERVPGLFSAVAEGGDEI